MSALFVLLVLPIIALCVYRYCSNVTVVKVNKGWLHPFLRLAGVRCLLVWGKAHRQVFVSSPDIRLTLRQGSNSSSSSIITHTGPPTRRVYLYQRSLLGGRRSRVLSVLVRACFQELRGCLLAFKRFVVASRGVCEVSWFF